MCHDYGAYCRISIPMFSNLQRLPWPRSPVQADEYGARAGKDMMGQVAMCWISVALLIGGVAPLEPPKDECKEARLERSDDGGSDP